MLVERESSSNVVFRIGETVKIVHLGQTGTIVGYANNQWQVKLTEGNIVPCDGTSLEKKQILMG